MSNFNRFYGTGKLTNDMKSVSKFLNGTLITAQNFRKFHDCDSIISMKRGSPHSSSEDKRKTVICLGTMRAQAVLKYLITDAKKEVMNQDFTDMNVIEFVIEDFENKVILMDQLLKDAYDEELENALEGLDEFVGERYPEFLGFDLTDEGLPWLDSGFIEEYANNSTESISVVIDYIQLCKGRTVKNEDTK